MDERNTNIEQDQPVEPPRRKPARINLDLPRDPQGIPMLFVPLTRALKMGSELPTPKSSFYIQPVASGSAHDRRQASRASRAAALEVTMPHADVYARLEEGFAEAKGSGFFDVRCAANDPKKGEITIYGPIGGDFWGDGVTMEGFAKELAKLKDVQELDIYISSLGGNVFDGIDIYNMILAHPAPIKRAHIGAVAASIATLIPMACDTISMVANGEWMTHSARAGFYGTEEDGPSFIKMLADANHNIRITYSARTGKPVEDLKQEMLRDTWITAAEALAAGWIDEIKPLKTSAKAASRAAAHALNQVVIDGRQLAEMLPHAQLVLSAFAKGAGGSGEGRGASGEESGSGVNCVQICGTAADAKRINDFLGAGGDGTKQGATSASVTNGESKMNPKLRAQCVAAGMAATLTDEQAQDWLANNFAIVAAKGGDGASAGGTTPPAAAANPPPPAAMTATDLANAFNTLSKAEKDDRRKKLATFQAEVKDRLELAFGAVEHAPEGLSAKCLAEFDGTAEDPVAAARKLIIDAKAALGTSVSGGGTISHVGSGRDDFMKDAGTALSLRAMSHAQCSQATIDRVLPMDQRGRGHANFQNAGLMDVARGSLHAHGIPTDHLDPFQIACIALGMVIQANLPHAVRIRAEAAVHTTGTLGLMALDVMQKSLAAGYDEAPSTWEKVMRRGTPVPDFKEKHIIRMSGIPNAPVWPDNDIIKQAMLANEREKYGVEARAYKLSFSWQSIVNNDLDAISRAPSILGGSFRRSINAFAWALITSNPTMQDGQPLFLETPTGRRFRSNLTVGAAVPDKATLGIMEEKMLLMRGVNGPDVEGNPVEGSDILSLMPEYMAVPTGHLQSARTITNSPSDPSQANPTVNNPYQNLKGFVEPLLNLSSNKAFYLFASTSRVDTAEISFLQGFESPRMTSAVDQENLCHTYSTIQAWGGKALDYRGVQKHKGEA